ncbi:MAG TPA: galactokinase [Bdellovibrionales bacterium]|nr:galactokinase [Bdellovibrionales bacterium]
MTKVSAKSPTRVDLAGGTLDLWPLYTFLGRATTLNVAIDIFTYAEITQRSDRQVTLIIDDMSAKKTYASVEECLADEDGSFRLLREHVRYWKPPFGFELRTRSESPVGGGLGGSSSLSVTLLGAFSRWLDRKLTVDQAVTAASNIEAKVLHVPTGTQDYYPPLLGGLNLLHYSADGCKPQKFVSKACFAEIEKHFILVYTGKPHQSGLNNWEVLKDTIEKRGNAMAALGELKVVADEMVRVLNAGHWSAIKDLLNEEYNARVKLSSVFTSPEIERLKRVSLEAGAEAVKICGAGGGGCVLVWSPPEVREGVIKQCRNAGFQVLPARPIEQGLAVEVAG